MLYADVVELADTLDLGSSASGMQVQVLSSAPKYENPNLIPIGDGFGFSVFSSRMIETSFALSAFQALARLFCQYLYKHL